MSFLGKVKVIMLKGEKGDQGDAGVSGDYAGLTNKPIINGHTLSGSMTSGDLGLESAGGIDIVANELRSELANFKDNFVVISDSVSVTGGTPKSKGYGSSALSTNYGIDNILDWTVIGVMMKNGSYYYSPCFVHSNNKVYPYVTIDSANLMVNLYSSNTETVDFDVVLMKKTDDASE